MSNKTKAIIQTIKDAKWLLMLIIYAASCFIVDDETGFKMVIALVTFGTLLLVGFAIKEGYQQNLEELEK